jgi:hypothetical protein
MTAITIFMGRPPFCVGPAIPGNGFSVNPTSGTGVAGLYARNVPSLSGHGEGLLPLFEAAGIWLENGLNDEFLGS